MSRTECLSWILRIQVTALVLWTTITLSDTFIMEENFQNGGVTPYHDGKATIAPAAAPAETEGDQTGSED